MKRFRLLLLPPAVVLELLMLGAAWILAVPVPRAAAWIERRARRLPSPKWYTEADPHERVVKPRNEET